VSKLEAARQSRMAKKLQ